MYNFRDASENGRPRPTVEPRGNSKPTKLKNVARGDDGHPGNDVNKQMQRPPTRRRRQRLASSDLTLLVVVVPTGLDDGSDLLFVLSSVLAVQLRSRVVCGTVGVRIVQERLN